MVLLFISLWMESNFVNVFQNICTSPCHSFEGFIRWREMNMCFFICDYFNTTVNNSAPVSLLQYPSRNVIISLFTSTPFCSLQHEFHHFHTSLVISTPISSLDYQTRCCKTSFITWTSVHHRFTWFALQPWNSHWNQLMTTSALEYWNTE